MHIFIKKNYLIFQNYKVKCAIGKRGINIKKKEGDLITPKGTFKIKKLLYRRDKIGAINTNLKKTVIKKNMGWCNDIASKDYNKLISFPFKFTAEKLYRKDNIYDLILVLNYNMNPIKKGKGSAIFIHVAKNNFKATEGCVALKKNNLKRIVKKLNKNIKVIIT